MNLNTERIHIPRELHVYTSADVFLWPQALSLSMAFGGTELAESAYSPWLILGLFALRSLDQGPQVQIQRAEERQAETLLGNERMEAGSNQGSSPLTFYAGRSWGSSCLSPGQRPLDRMLGFQLPWTLDPGTPHPPDLCSRGVVAPSLAPSSFQPFHHR